jgi:hypothetical protein
MPSSPVRALQRQRGRLGCRVAFALLALTLLVGGCRHAEARPLLQVTECDSKKTLLETETGPGGAFSVWFFHSYDRAPFEEHYRVLPGGRILLTRMTFKASLNGQGFALGKYRPLEDGWAELYDIDREMDQVVFRLGSPDLADHTLKIPGRRLRLLDHAEPGTLICIRAPTD